MEKCYHIGLDASHGARYAILPGDPGRVPTIAAYLDNAHPLAQNREYTTWLGQLEGENVLVMSTGMGGPSTAIGVEELFQTGVDTFVRIGSCGGMATQVMGGDLVVAQAAIRMEGTSRQYVDIQFPAVGNLEVTNALLEAGRRLQVTTHVGVVHCKDSFYGQHSPQRMPAGKELTEKWEQWLKAGCLASEMESAALFVVAQVLGARAGCILSVLWNQERKQQGLSDPHCHDMGKAIAASVEGVRTLIQREKAAGV